MEDTITSSTTWIVTAVIGVVLIFAAIFWYTSSSIAMTPNTPNTGTETAGDSTSDTGTMLPVTD